MTLFLLEQETDASDEKIGLAGKSQSQNPLSTCKFSINIVNKERIGDWTHGSIFESADPSTTSKFCSDLCPDPQWQLLSFVIYYSNLGPKYSNSAETFVIIVTQKLRSVPETESRATYLL